MMLIKNDNRPRSPIHGSLQAITGSASYFSESAAGYAVALPAMSFAYSRSRIGFDKHV